MNNEKERKKISSFTDLTTWKVGPALVISIYKVTKKFPREEQFGLIDQLRRASVSITSNIAGGFSRNSYKEKIKFYYMSLGSLTEIQNQLIIAKDLGYITPETFNEIAGHTITVSKLCNGLIKKSKDFILNS